VDAESIQLVSLGEGDEMSRERDQIRPMRGVVLAVLLCIPFWAFVWWLLW
jgi:hypothetical protein